MSKDARLAVSLSHVALTSATSVYSRRANYYFKCRKENHVPMLCQPNFRLQSEHQVAHRICETSIEASVDANMSSAQNNIAVFSSMLKKVKEALKMVGHITPP